MRAAIYGEAGMVKLLVDAGANVNAVTEHGVTALMKVAIQTGRARRSSFSCAGLTAACAIVTG